MFIPELRINFLENMSAFGPYGERKLHQVYASWSVEKTTEALKVFKNDVLSN